jgi:hypothetical protein
LNDLLGAYFPFNSFMEICQMQQQKINKYPNKLGEPEPCQVNKKYFSS